MENANGFYKYESELLYAPNYVECTQYSLMVTEKDNYTLPIDGWYYFETEQEAIDFFEIVEVPQTETI